MYVNQVNFNKNSVNHNKLQRKQQQVQNYSSGVQTSLYNTKGMNVYFGGLAKGVDVIENQCIDILRAARDGVRRKFAENDIEDIVKSLKVVKKPEEKPEILQEIIALDEGTPISNKDFFKNIVGLVADKPENERFAILEFAANELENAAKPMDAFLMLPRKTQDELTNLLCQIDYINDMKLFKNDDARSIAIESLYNTFRVPLYAHDDLDKIDRAFRGAYKKRNLEILNADRDFYENQDYFKDESSKEKFMIVVDNITDYFKNSI